MSDQLDRPLADTVTYKGVRLSEVPKMAAKIKRLEGELAEARKPNQRLYDLVRHQRMELHEAELVTDEEYIKLAKDHSAVARLEDYDAIKAQLDQARKRRETLAALLNAASGWIQCTDNCSIHNGRECDCGAADVLAKAEAALASEQEGK